MRRRRVTLTRPASGGRLRSAVTATLVLLGTLSFGSAAAAAEPMAPAELLGLVLGDPQRSGERVSLLRKELDSNWHPGYAVMLVELLPFVREGSVRQTLVNTLERKTGQRHGLDTQAWFVWLWSRPEELHPAYAEFKSQLYGYIDPRFQKYFSSDRPRTIRLDEVRWGGVRQDGIPPLRHPKMVRAEAATYLDDRNVVFGLEVNGDARAYPKRILAWHELFTDEVGGVAVAGVYCTLCGTVILYETELEGTSYELGTSGFLYRSNKLMYDRATQSLWNTIWGRPVIGPLVGKEIQLVARSVVTTTWGEWRRRHPETQVLALDTGHERDYSEGAAYRDYFATDELMFEVPQHDRRLANKDEVLTIVLDRGAQKPLAIAASFLLEHELYHDRLGPVDLVVLTDRSGANRVYATGGLRFTEWDRDRTVVDEAGGIWSLSEAALRSRDGRELERLPAHRAFWFGWYAAYPETRLVE